MKINLIKLVKGLTSGTWIKIPDSKIKFRIKIIKYLDFCNSPISIFAVIKHF